VALNSLQSNAATIAAWTAARKEGSHEWKDEVLYHTNALGINACLLFFTLPHPYFLTLPHSSTFSLLFFLFFLFIPFIPFIPTLPSFSPFPSFYSLLMVFFIS
jgi:hypothetical protein